MADLTREEFLTHIQYVRGDLAEVVEHLGELNGRTRENAEDLARHDERLKTVELANKSDPAARWVGGLAAIGIVLAEVAHRLWGGK